MAKITWDATGSRFYQTGLDRGVLYPVDKESKKYGKGVPWNGLTSVTENPSGAETTALYADNIKYQELVSAETFGCTVEAYTYPTEFEACDGSAEVAPGVSIGQQARSRFAFSYRTKIGDDIDGQEHGYKIHLVYGCQAAPSSRTNQTINESPEAMTMSWEITTTPINVEGFKPTATLIIDSTKVDAAKLKKIEDKLYGTDSAEPTLILPDEIAAILNAAG